MSKVALCLSGKIGNVQGKSGFFESDPRVLIKGHEHYQRHILDKMMWMFLYIAGTENWKTRL